MHASEARLEGKLPEGKLPGLVARAFAVIRRDGGEPFVEIGLRCDTVWLFRRGGRRRVPRLDVRRRPRADVVHLLVACEKMGKPRPVEHYLAARERRLDKDRGAIAEPSDSDLMPERDSGVARNVSFGEVGQWTRSKGIALANSERGRARMFEQARARMIEAGEDPSVLGPPPAPAPAPPPTEPSTPSSRSWTSSRAGSTR